MPQKEQLLGIDEAAKELGVSRQTIYDLIKRGVLRKFKRPVGHTRAFVSAQDVARAKQPQEEYP